MVVAFDVGCPYWRAWLRRFRAPSSPLELAADHVSLSITSTPEIESVTSDRESVLIIVGSDPGPRC